MYATIGTSVPDGDGWTFEPKYDGIRVLAFVTKDAVRLVTRNGNDKTKQFPEIAESLRALARKAERELVVDGEIIAVVDGEVARSRRSDRSTSRTRSPSPTLPKHSGRDRAFHILVDGPDILLRTLDDASHISTVLADCPHRCASAAIPADCQDSWARRVTVEGSSPNAPALYDPASARKLSELKVEHRRNSSSALTEPRNTRGIWRDPLGYFDGCASAMSGIRRLLYGRAGLNDMYKRLAPSSARRPPSRPAADERARTLDAP